MTDKTEKTKKSPFSKLWVRVLTGVLAAVLLVVTLTYYFYEKRIADITGTAAQMAEVEETQNHPSLRAAPVSYGTDSFLKAMYGDLLKDPDGLYNAAVASINGSDYDGAEKYIELLKPYYGNDADTMAVLNGTLAELYYSTGDYELCAERCQDVLDAGKDSDGSYQFLLGAAQLQAGKYEEAVAALTEAENKGFDQESCEAQMAIAEYYRGNYEAVLEHAGKISQNYDNGASDNQLSVLYVTALSLMQLGKKEECISVFDQLKSLRSDPDDAYYQGVAYLMSQNYQSAEDDFAKALELGMSGSSIHYYYGVSAYANGDKEIAKEQLQMVVDNGDDAELTDSAQALLKEIG